MTNIGMKAGVNSQEDAAQYLKYLDGTAYTSVPGLEPSFWYQELQPFRMVYQEETGRFQLYGVAGSNNHHFLCQYNCPCKSISEFTLCDSHLVIWSRKSLGHHLKSDFDSVHNFS